MQASGMPEAIVRAWGPDVARDFVAWLEERLSAAQFPLQVQVSAFVVGQKVNVLMLEQVSNPPVADEPRLVQTPSESWIWRVPVDLTFPAHGRVGRVGEVDVDAHYGAVRYDDVLLTQIAGEAEWLAQHILHPAT